MMHGATGSTAVLEGEATVSVPGRLTAPLCLLWHVLVPTLVLLPSLVWVVMDRSVWPWDQSWYGEVSVELYDWLRHDLWKWAEAMRSAFGAKAPGIAWFGQFFVPLAKVVGSIDLALHLSVLVCQWITLALIYRIGRLMFPECSVLVPLSGCLLSGTAPLFVGLSHQYFTEPLQTMAVSWVLYAAVKAPGSTRLETLTHLIAAGSVAMLAKFSSPAYCLFPGLLALLPVFSRRAPAVEAGPLRTTVRWLCFFASFALLAATVAWYQKNLGTILAFVYESSVGENALFYGHKDVLLVKLSYWINALQVGLFTCATFWCVLLLGGAGAVVAVVRLRKRLAGRVLSQSDLLAVCCLLHIVLFLLMAARSINEETRYLLPLLPLLAVLCMWALVQVKTRWGAVTLIAVLLMQWVYVFGVAFGHTEQTACSWLIPVETDAGKAREVAAVLEWTSREEVTANRMNIVGVEIPWFNFNTFDYCAAKNKLLSGRRPYYTSLGYAESDERKAFQRLEEMKIIYFITLEGGIPRDFVNQVSESISQRIARDPRFVRQAYPSTHGVVIYRQMGG